MERIEIPFLKAFSIPTEAMEDAIDTISLRGVYEYHCGEAEKISKTILEEDDRQTIMERIRSYLLHRAAAVALASHLDMLTRAVTM